MKQITLPLALTGVLFFLLGCQSGSESNNNPTGSSSNSASKAKNEMAAIEETPIYTFSVVPDNFTGCTGIFAQTEDEMTTNKFIFATDLKNSCVIGIDGRMVQIELVAKQTANLQMQFYKFEGKGYLIDLEIREIEKVDQHTKKYRGQLKINDTGSYRDVFYIIGEVKC